MAASSYAAPIEYLRGVVYFIMKDDFYNAKEMLKAVEDPVLYAMGLALTGSKDVDMSVQKAAHDFYCKELARVTQR